ncbi:hypothetical protein Tco_0504996 [Tanacetum coccineum]
MKISIEVRKEIVMVEEMEMVMVEGMERWFKKMKSVYRISNCPSSSQVKFATCTLLDGALTWWNSYVQTIGIDEANEIQKLENELWNLSLKGTDVAGYTQRFQELSLLCPRIVLEEKDKI